MKKFLITMMCVIMVIAMMPAMAMAETTPATQVSTYEQLVAAVANGGSIELTDEIVIPAGETLTIPASAEKPVTIDAGTLVDAIQVEGTLTLNAGADIVGEKAILWVKPGGTVNVAGGTITKQTSAERTLDAAYVEGTLNVSAGSISSNTINVTVAVAGGTVNVSGTGEISSERASAIGIDTGRTGTINISGGRVSTGSTGAESAVYAMGGNVSVIGGTVTGGSTALSATYTGQAEIDGAEAVVAGISTNHGDTAKITVKNGTVTGTVAANSGKIEISGGTFDTLPEGTNVTVADDVNVYNHNTKFVVSAEVPETSATHEWKDTDSDGIFELVEIALTGSGTENDPYKVDSYKELAAAVEKGGNIELTDEIVIEAGKELTIPASAEKPVTINTKDFVDAIQVAGTLTLNDGAAITGTDAILWIKTGGTVNVAGGTITKQAAARNHDAVYVEGTLNVSAGSISSNNINVTVAVAGGTVNVSGTGEISSEKASAIGIDNANTGTGIINISGGTVSTGSTGAESAVYAMGGTINVTGGTVTGGSTALSATYTGQAVIDGAEAVVAGISTNHGETAKITVKNGKVTGTIAENAGTIEISGGTFESNPKEFATTNVYSEDGTFTVASTAPSVPAGQQWVLKEGVYVLEDAPQQSYYPSVTIEKPVVESADNATVTIGILGNTATIVAADGYEIVNVTVNGVSKGAVTSLSGLKTGDKIVVVTKAIEVEPTEPAEPTVEEVQAVLDTIKLDADSAQVTLKNGKKAVKITWKTAEGADVEFDGIEIQRSMKRYSGYGKKPFFTTEKDVYYNTAIETGKKYYYRVRGFVEVDGEKVYTDYSLKAWRTVK